MEEAHFLTKSSSKGFHLHLCHFANANRFCSFFSI